MPLRNADEEVDLVKNVLADSYAQDLDYGGIIRIGPTDEGTIEVEWEHAEGRSQAIFLSEDVDEAARFFADKRKELREGLDDKDAKRVFTVGTRHGRKILYEPAPGSIPEEHLALHGQDSGVDVDAFIHWLEHGGEPPTGV